MGHPSVVVIPAKIKGWATRQLSVVSFNCIGPLLPAGMTKKCGDDPWPPQLITFPDGRTRRFEPASRNGSEDKTSNVGQVCHSAGLHLRYLSCADQLN